MRLPPEKNKGSEPKNPSLAVHTLFLVAQGELMPSYGLMERP